jgi:hypothetical protein
MFDKKVLIGTLILIILNLIMRFLWYDILMVDDFPTMEGAARAQPKFLVLFIAVFIFSHAFVRLFQLVQNTEEPFIKQAVRFGFLVGILSTVVNALFQYGNMEIWTGTHSVVDAIFNVIVAIIMAIILTKIFAFNTE